MRRLFEPILGFAVLGALLFVTPPAFADTQHFWSVASPDHEQTFGYGSEQHRVWADQGHDRHLVVLLDFTNDPYVDNDNPRQYDNFTFTFPGVTMGKDGRTFSYHATDGRLIPVASKHPGFLGIDEIKLLPNACLRVTKPHGYLTVSLLIQD